MLDLYGDSGNMEIVKYRCKMRDISCQIDYYSTNMEIPDFSSYDLIYIGGGADLEQQLLSADLQRCRDELKKAYNNGVFFLLICGGYQLMGKYYKDADGNKIPGLGLFDYYTIAPSSRKKRCIGNIVIKTMLTGKPVNVVGFENHGGQTSNVKSPFGEVMYGNGNMFQSDTEGFIEKNIIATYLHGPLLAKNPEITDYILQYCLNKKEGTSVMLTPLNDLLEIKCRDVMVSRLLKK